MTPHLNHLKETVLVMGQKICFYGEVLLIIRFVMLAYLVITQLHIIGGTEDNSKIIFLISQQKQLSLNFPCYPFLSGALVIRSSLS